MNTFEQTTEQLKRIKFIIQIHAIYIYKGYWTKVTYKQYINEIKKRLNLHQIPNQEE